MRRLTTGNVHYGEGNHPDVVGKHFLQTGEGPEPSGTGQGQMRAVSGLCSLKNNVARCFWESLITCWGFRVFIYKAEIMFMILSECNEFTMHKKVLCLHIPFSCGHVWMWEVDCEESWVPKNWCFWIVVLEKTLESPLDGKEIQPVHSKGDQSWVFIGRTDAKAETPIFWPPHAKSWLIGKDPDAGRHWGQEKKGMTEDEMAFWHHWLDGHEFG